MVITFAEMGDTRKMANLGEEGDDFIFVHVELKGNLQFT